MIKLCVLIRVSFKGCWLAVMICVQFHALELMRNKLNLEFLKIKQCVYEAFIKESKRISTGFLECINDLL